jgi:hypothetical protein
MATRSYERLGIVPFGRHLITSGDLDPVYIALVKMELDQRQLYRWLIAYWCLYHCGAACYLSEREGPEFWKGLMAAAKNDAPAPTSGRWPRGHERRHFRGEAAVKATKVLWGRFLNRPEEMVERLLEGMEEPMPYEMLAPQVKEYPLFGPWISFKVCDMVDRVLGRPVDFTQAAVFMFDDPVKAALMLWRKHHGYDECVSPKHQGTVIAGVVQWLESQFKELTAPPLHDRPIGLQEVETVLCKWKSHMNGHYPLNNDIDEISGGLEEWRSTCDTVKQFEHHMPRRMV